MNASEANPASNELYKKLQLMLTCSTFNIAARPGVSRRLAVGASLEEWRWTARWTEARQTAEETGEGRELDLDGTNEMTDRDSLAYCAT